ncbi:MAG: RluA family pseudouridine synthase [Bacteroidia bacterium]
MTDKHTHLNQQLGQQSESGDEQEQDDLFEHHRLTIDKGQQAVRIDKFLIDRLPGASRNRIQNAIKAGSVLVDGREIKASYKIKPGEMVQVILAYPPRDTTIYPEEMDLNILFEDEELLILNKPAGLVVHPGHGNPNGTLVNGLVHHFGNLPTHRNGDIRPGLVHRIDKDTSGLLVIAKTEYSMTHLAKQFFDHSIDRAYWALVWGDYQEEEGTVNAHLDRHPQDRTKMAAYPDGSKGKHAITHYKVLERFGYVSLLSYKLETGRTHQIRVHSAFTGHPIFNDGVYGGNRLVKGTTFNKYKQFIDNCFQLMPRMALHAKSIGFSHPTTGERLYFESDLPADFTAVLEKWRHYIRFKPSEEEE